MVSRVDMLARRLRDVTTLTISLMASQAPARLLPGSVYSMLDAAFAFLEGLLLAFETVEAESWPRTQNLLGSLEESLLELWRRVALARLTPTVIIAIPDSGLYKLLYTLENHGKASFLG